jgi:hypothetical protein
VPGNGLMQQVLIFPPLFLYFKIEEFLILSCLTGVTKSKYSEHLKKKTEKSEP